MLVDFPPGGRDQGPMAGGGHPGGEFGSRLSMLEDLDPKATRSLFVGNIPKHINVYDLRDAFIRYGTVLVRNSSVFVGNMLALFFPPSCDVAKA